MSGKKKEEEKKEEKKKERRERRMKKRRWRRKMMISRIAKKSFRGVGVKIFKSYIVKNLEFFLIIG